MPATLEWFETDFATPLTSLLLGTVPPGGSYYAINGGYAGAVIENTGDTPFGTVDIEIQQVGSDEMFNYLSVAKGKVAPGAFTSYPSVLSLGALGVTQLTTVTIANTVNNQLYTVTINGVDYTYMSDASATAGEIAIGLVDDVNLDGGLAVTAATTAGVGDVSATLTLTADAANTYFSVAVDANLTAAETAMIAERIWIELAPTAGATPGLGQLSNLVASGTV